MLPLTDLVLAACLDAFAEPATYLPPNGQRIPIRGVFDEKSAVDKMANGIPTIEQHPVIGLRLAELPAGVSIQPAHLLEVRGARYRVIDLQPDGQGFLKLVLGATRA